MKTLPNAIKVIGNAFFFVIYALIGTNIVSFIFGGILTLLGRTVPGPEALIHIKIAALSAIFILLVTILYRKFFYMPLTRNQSDS